MVLAYAGSLSLGTLGLARLSPSGTSPVAHCPSSNLCACLRACLCVRVVVCMRARVCMYAARAYDCTACCVCVVCNVCVDTRGACGACVRACACAHVRMCACAHACMRACVHVCLRACLRAFMRVCVCLRACVCVGAAWCWGCQRLTQARLDRWLVPKLAREIGLILILDGLVLASIEPDTLSELLTATKTLGTCAHARPCMPSVFAPLCSQLRMCAWMRGLGARVRSPVAAFLHGFSLRKSCAVASTSKVAMHPSLRECAHASQLA